MLVRGQRGQERVWPIRNVVLAASCVETTRILLDSGLLPVAPQLGQNLVSHLSVSAALVQPQRSDAPAPMWGDVTVSWPHRKGAGRRFILEIEPLPALGAVRAEWGPALGVSPGDGAQVTLIVALGDRSPRPGQEVTLHPFKIGARGRPLPIIHLRANAEDQRTLLQMKEACVRAADALAAPGGELIFIRDPGDQDVLFHEAGTCAMGRTSDAVCDPFGRVRALENVWVADSAAMPSAGDRHPTLTLLAHGQRVVRSVVRHLKRGL